MLSPFLQFQEAVNLIHDFSLVPRAILVSWGYLYLEEDRKRKQGEGRHAESYYKKEGGRK